MYVGVHATYDVYVLFACMQGATLRVAKEYIYIRLVLVAWARPTQCFFTTAVFFVEHVFFFFF